MICESFKGHHVEINENILDVQCGLKLLNLTVYPLFYMFMYLNFHVSCKVSVKSCLAAGVIYYGNIMTQTSCDMEKSWQILSKL